MIFLFVILSLSSIGIDFLVWRQLTPNIIAITPTFLLTVLCASVGPALGFSPLSDEFYQVLSLFFLLGALASFSVGLLLGPALLSVREQVAFCMTRNFHTGFLKFLLLIVLFVLIVSVVSSYVKIENLHEESFSGTLSYGFIGHCFVFLMVAVPIFLFCKKKFDITSAGIVLLSIILLLLKQVKSWLVIPILFYALLCYSSGRVKGWKTLIFKILLLVVILSLVFFIVYFINHLSYSGFQISQELVINSIYSTATHFLSYLFAGILGFSELLRTQNIFSCDGNWHYLVLTLYNIFSVVQGGAPDSAVVDQFLIINEQFSKSSNVFTLWGTLLLRSGWVAFFIYPLLIGSLTAFLVFFRTALVFFLLYCYIVSFLGIAWFEYYYYHLAVFEGVVFIFLLSILLHVNILPRAININPGGRGNL